MNYRDVPNGFLFIVFFLLCLADANAEVYKWIDEDGKVVYGDKPTSYNADEIKIKKAVNRDSKAYERYKEKKNCWRSCKKNVMKEMH